MTRTPLAIVNKAWRHHVVRHGTVDSQAYTFASSIDGTAPCGDASSLWPQACGMPTRGLGCWKARAGLVPVPSSARTLGLPPTPAEALAALRQQLDHTYRAVAANLPHNDAVRIEPTDGQEELVVSAWTSWRSPPRWWPYARR